METFWRISRACKMQPVRQANMAAAETAYKISFESFPYFVRD